VGDDRPKLSGVALAHELIQPGENLQLTGDQRKAVDAITAGLDAGTFEFLLKAPTGSARPEVMLRVAVDTILATGGYVVIPRADARPDPPARHLLLRPPEGTGIGVGQTTAARTRRTPRGPKRGSSNGTIHVVVGSAMMLTIDRHWGSSTRAIYVRYDDVNAFDEARSTCGCSRARDCPMPSASATPDELRRFLDRIGRCKNVV